MTMKFYDALQMDPSVLKRKIAACGTKQEKAYYWFAIAARSVLIVAFAIVFIGGLSAVFGADNTPMGVALFCMMLGIRFVNFEYCIGDSLISLGAVLAILVLAPSAAAVLPVPFLIPLHFAAFFALISLTTQRPEMGNGGLYSFAYIYLVGNPVAGEAPMRRGLLALTGYLLCGLILLQSIGTNTKPRGFTMLCGAFRSLLPLRCGRFEWHLASAWYSQRDRYFQWSASCGWASHVHRSYRNIPTVLIQAFVSGRELSEPLQALSRFWCFT